MRHRSANPLVTSCLAFSAAILAFASAAYAQPGQRRAVEAASTPVACAPSCRSGYTCVQGQCVSACNPVCGADEQCTAAGECVKPSAPPPAVVALPASYTSTPTMQAPPPTMQAPPSPPVAAAPADQVGSPSATRKGVHLHDGFYFRGALGAGFVASGSFTPPSSGKGASQDIGVSGGGPSVDLALGATVYEGLVVGGGIFGASLPSPSYSASGITAAGGSALVSSLGPFADWYFDPSGGFHALAGVGYAVIAASKGTPVSAGGSTITIPDRDQGGSGVSLVAGGGYEWWVSDQVSLGVLARVQYVTGSVKGDGAKDSTNVNVLIPSLALAITYN